MSKILKLFGILYLLGNLVFCAAFLILTFSSDESSQISVWFYPLIPLVGMLSGYWISRAKYGWKRGVIIAFSLICTVAALLITLVVGPQLKQLETKAVSPQIVQKNPIEVEIQRLFLGVYTNDLKIVTEQLAKRVDVNARNETRQTPLHVTQHPDIARLLIDHGADLTAKNDSGMIPIFNKEVPVASILLDAGTDINAQSEDGNTLLLWYTYSGYLDGITYLINRGANINICNTDGHNALDIAEHFQPNSVTLRYLQTLDIQPCPQ